MATLDSKGLVPPNFLIDKALNQIGIALKNTQAGGTIVDSLVRRTKEKGIPGDWDARARKIATSEVVPALQRDWGSTAAGAAWLVVAGQSNGTQSQEAEPA